MQKLKRDIPAQSRLFQMLVLLLFALWVVPVAAQLPGIDANQTISVATAKLLPSKLLKGDDYSLDTQTGVYRTVALFRMKTAFGSATLVGREGLLERIDELSAIKQLEAMKRSEVFKDSFKSSVAAPVDAVKSLFKEPSDTLSDVGRGLGNYFADVGHSIASDDPNDENVAKTAVGYAVAKRQLAYELGVNPYSKFQPLQDQLDEVAWAAVGGGVTVSMGFRAIGGAAGTALTVTRTANGMRQLVRDNSPRQLQDINYDKLIAMGVGEQLAEAMLDNYAYDPENETRLIGALDAMKGVPGRVAFIRRAALQGQPYNARLMREWAELLAAYHNNVEKVAAIVLPESAPLLQLRNGTVLALYPADYITDDAPFLQRLGATVAALHKMELQPGEIWLPGRIDPAVESKLRQLGWQGAVGDVTSRLTR